MKNKLIIMFLLLSICLNGFSQESGNASSNKNGFSVKQISFTKWSDSDGVPYKQVPGANLGAVAFQVINKNKVAFLCNSSSQIIIINKKTQKTSNKFDVQFAPRDFIYESGFFYVLGERKLNKYSENGQEIFSITFPTLYLGTERIARFNNATYLLLPSGNCVKIESDGKGGEEKESEGWITQSGNFVSTQLVNNSYSITINTPNGKLFQKTFITKRKAAGAFIVGCTDDRLVLDVCTYISENPVEVEREFISIEITYNGIGEIITTQKALSSYFVISNKEIDLTPSREIFNMVSAPDGIYVFQLKELKSAKKQNYPLSLQKIRYHYNDHLLKID